MESLKFKVTSIVAIVMVIAFTINWVIAIKTIHTQKEKDVENVLHHLLVESKDEYLNTDLSSNSDLSFLYSVPHIEMILRDSEVNNLRLKVTKIPCLSGAERIVSCIRLSNGYYLNAISDHGKIDLSVLNYGKTLFLRYLLSFLAVLIIAMSVLHYYMKPLSSLAQKTRSWTKNEPFDVTEENASLEIKEVAHAFSVLVKRMETYRIKEAQLFKEAAHELKTPLALMRSRLDVYEESDHYDKTRFIQEFAKDIDRLTTELKSVLFLESSDFEEVSRIDVRRMLDELQTKMDILVQRKNLRITISDETFTLLAPQKLLRKVCSALMENAMTYAHDGTEIRVEINVNNRSVSIHNAIGNDKYLFSSKIGNKLLKRLSQEIGYEYDITEAKDRYSIRLTFNH